MTKGEVLEKDKGYLNVLKRLRYPVILVDDSDMLLWANQRFLTSSGMQRDNIEELETSYKVQAKLSEAIKSGEYTFKDNVGLYSSQPIRSPFKIEGTRYTLISFFDISRRQQLQVDLLSKQKMFEQLSEYLPEGIVLVQKNILYTNPAFERLSGHSGTELLSKRLIDLLEPMGQAIYEANIQLLLSRKRSYVESVLGLVTKKGASVWVRIKTSRLKQGEVEQLLNIVTDVSDERHEIQKLTQMAYFDGLTGIYNRRKFNELLLVEYQRARRYDRHLCGLFFDIDHFKHINDTYGHDVGDIVLEELARLVQSNVRETDFFARWGGEEFIILLPETTAEETMVLAEHIREMVNAYHFPKVGDVKISIGITSLKGKERSQTFIKRLDSALYLAKSAGRDRSVII